MYKNKELILRSNGFKLNNLEYFDSNNFSELLTENFKLNISMPINVVITTVRNLKNKKIFLIKITLLHLSLKIA